MLCPESSISPICPRLAAHAHTLSWGADVDLRQAVYPHVIMITLKVTVTEGRERLSIAFYPSCQVSSLWTVPMSWEQPNNCFRKSQHLISDPVTRH